VKKAEILRHFQAVAKGGARKIKPRPVPYKHKGSTFDQDGVRILGSRDFIDSILSILAPHFLPFENGETRLQVVLTQAKDKNTGAALDSWTCYIQVHERGGEAKIANALVSALAGKEVIVSSGV